MQLVSGSIETFNEAMKGNYFKTSGNFSEGFSLPQLFFNRYVIFSRKLVRISVCLSIICYLA